MLFCVDQHVVRLFQWKCVPTGYLFFVLCLTAIGNWDQESLNQLWVVGAAKVLIDRFTLILLVMLFCKGGNKEEKDRSGIQLHCMEFTWYSDHVQMFPSSVEDAVIAVCRSHRTDSCAVVTKPISLFPLAYWIILYSAMIGIQKWQRAVESSSPSCS